MEITNSDRVLNINQETVILEKEKRKFKLSGIAIFNIVVGLMTAILLIYFVVSDGGIIDLLKSDEGIIWWLLVVGVLVYDSSVVVDAIVTYIFVSAQYPKVRFIDALKISCVGVFFSAITPSNTGGQPMQLFLMSKMNISVGFGSACMTQKFIVYQFVTMAFSIIAIITNFDLFSSAFTSFWSTAFVIIGFLVQLAITALFLVVSFSEKLTGKLLGLIIKILRKFKVKNADKKIAKLTREFRMFLDSNRLLMQNKKRVAIIYGLVAVQVLLILSVPYIVYLSFDTPAIASASGQPVGSWYEFVCIQSFVLFTSNLIPLPGASGGAEAAFALYFAGFFLGRTKPAIVAWRFMTYYGAIILTAPFSYYTKGHKEHAKKIEDEVNGVIEDNRELEHQT